MSNLDALGQFEESLKMAEELMKLEQQNFRNPPRMEEQNAVEGLRGGAIVLMVAAWERFVKQLIEEELAPFATNPARVRFSDLPQKMQIHSAFHSLKYALDGPRFQQKPEFDRLPDIRQAAQNFIQGMIDPQSFSDIGSNPNPRAIKGMFLRIGINDIFDYIQVDFEREWDHPASSRVIKDKLDGILNRRHSVAHKADTLDISREDLQEDIRFMKILAIVVDRKVRLYIEELIDTSANNQ
jgi:hypothetical protein